MLPTRGTRSAQPEDRRHSVAPIFGLCLLWQPFIIHNIRRIPYHKGMNSPSGTQPVITPDLDSEGAVPREPGLTRALRRVSGAQLRPDNTLTLLQNGPDTFDDWLAAISRAQRWVHLENYIFKADQIGRRFADALSERAAAGVPVRVLYDWYGSWDVPSRFWQQ
ncbi:MAG: hypothetical protein CYG59_18185, partial [Chloroflexi bacterium]